MSVSVHKLDLPPLTPTMVLFCSCDGPLGFGVIQTSAARLDQAVRDALFLPLPGGRVLDSDQVAEARHVAETLRESGNLAFEDGWLRLCSGLADITAFFMERLAEAKAEEAYADERRYEEMKRADALAAKYAALRDALITAFGDKAPGVLALAQDAPEAPR